MREPETGTSGGSAREGSPPYGAQLATELEPLLGGLLPELASRLRDVLRVSNQRAARLQRLQGAVSSLTRSLDETEVVRDLCRGVLRVMAAEGVFVARPELDHDTVRVLFHVVGGEELEHRTGPLGDSAIGRAARAGEPLLVAEPSDSDRSVLGIGIRGALLLTPMMQGRRLMGVLGVHAPVDQPFSSDDTEAIRLLASQGASAISNAQLFAESERERRQSEALASAARAVGESLRLGEVLRLILRHATALLRAGGGCVALREDDYLHIVSAVGSGELLKGIHLPIGGSITGRAVLEGVPVIVNESEGQAEAHRPSQRLARIGKTIIVPMMTPRGIIGALSIFNRDADFQDEDARVLQRLADQVSVAIVNARLYEELSDATREWTSTFDAIGQAMVIVDEHGRISRYNGRALQLAKVEQSRELMGRPFYETFLGSAPAPAADLPVERAINEGVLVRGILPAPARGLAYRLSAAPHPNGGAIVVFDEERVAPQVLDRSARVLEAVPDALLTVDRDGRILWANGAARDFLRRGEVTGLTLRDLVPPELGDELSVRLQGALSVGIQLAESIVVASDGVRRSTMLSLAPLTFGGDAEGVVVALQDVSGERRAREAVSLSEARYHALFDTVSDAVFTLDTRGALTSANHAVADALDTPREALLGRSLYPFIREADVDRVTNALRDALAGQPRRLDFAVVRRDGAERWLDVGVMPIRQGRQVIGVQGVARDRTGEREQATALSRSEARYAQLVETAPDAIFTVDEEGNFTSVNRAFEEATGRSRDTLMGEHFSSMVDPRDRDALWELFVATLHGQRQRQQMRFIDAMGRTRWGAMVSSPLVEHGRVTGALALVRDVTDERRLLEESAHRLSDAGNASQRDPADPVQR